MNDSASDPPRAEPADQIITSPTSQYAANQGDGGHVPLSRTQGEEAGDPPGAKARHVDDYELLEELGRGGMGIVYKALHPKLNRLVALKMILAGGQAAEADLARFRREAIARAHHPHIVQIHEIGEHEGLPYMVLEFCPGGSLADKLDGTPWPTEPVLYGMGRYQDALESLQHAQKLAREPRHQCANLLWLALTYHQLGQEQLARECLQEADDLMRTWYPRAGEEIHQHVIEEYLECTILRREAEKLIQQPENRTTP
jgi:hypothetical protein